MSFRRLACATLLPCLLMLILGRILVPATQAQETETQQYVISIERIWDRAQHSAFTDIILFHDTLYCTFREGSGHIPGRNGLVRVIRSADGTNWESVALLDERHVDLRDPKLSLTPDGRLMINMGASYYEGSDRKQIQSRVSFSNAQGENFSRPQKVELPASVNSGFDWLWRVTWHEGIAWGAVQQIPSEDGRALYLVRSKDGIRYEQVTKLDVDHPTETTLRFLPDETLVAMTRRSGDSPEGWIGQAKAPYQEWKFVPSNRRFGGPNFVQLPDGSTLAGSRLYQTGGSKTELLWLNLDTAQFDHLLTLPSGGDNSYPGFVVDPKRNCVWVSYYSSHEGKASIYLATLRLDALAMRQATDD